MVHDFKLRTCKTGQHVSLSSRLMWSTQGVLRLRGLYLKEKLPLDIIASMYFCKFALLEISIMIRITSTLRDSVSKQAYKRNCHCTTEKVNEIVSMNIQWPWHVSASAQNILWLTLSSLHNLSLLHPCRHSNIKSSCANPTKSLSNSHITVAVNLC